MFRVVYSSRLAPAVGQAEIEAIIAGSKARNQEGGVTGVWLMAGRDCLSMLEGPPETVRATVERIWADKRHSDFQLRDMRAVTQRKFQGWPLRFIAVDEAGLEALEDDEALRWLCNFAGGPAAFAANGLPPESDPKD